MGPALQTIAGNHHTDGQNNHSETPPYGHLGNTVTSLLRLLFFGCLAKRRYIFLQKKTSLIRLPVYTANLFWPIGDRINGVLLYSG